MAAVDRESFQRDAAAVARLNLDLLPAPFVGSFHARVYVLRRNTEAHTRRLVTQLERLGYTVALDTPAA